MESAQRQDPEVTPAPIAEHLQPAVHPSPGIANATGRPANPYLLPGAIAVGLTMLGLFYFLASIYRPPLSPAPGIAQGPAPALQKKPVDQDDDEAANPKLVTKQASPTSLRELIKRVTAERSEATSLALKNAEDLAFFDEQWGPKLGWNIPGANDIRPSAFMIWHGDKKFKRPSNYNHMWALGGELSRIRLRLLELGKSVQGISIGRGSFDYYGNYAVYLSGYIDPFKSGDVVDLYGYITDLYQYETVEKKQRSIPGFAVLAAVKVGTADKARTAYLAAVKESASEPSQPKPSSNTPEQM